MASLSLSVLSTTRMMNCRVGGKNHTEWPLFKRHLQLWNATQRVGISGPRASQWALVTAMLITLCEREGERPCMTKDQRHVNVCEMWETPFKPNDPGKSCVITRYPTWLRPKPQPGIYMNLPHFGVKGWCCYSNCRVTTLYGSYSNRRVPSNSFVIDIQGFSAINLSFSTAHTHRLSILVHTPVICCINFS